MTDSNKDKGNCSADSRSDNSLRKSGKDNKTKRIFILSLILILGIGAVILYQNCGHGVAPEGEELCDTVLPPEPLPEPVPFPEPTPEPEPEPEIEEGVEYFTIGETELTDGEPGSQVLSIIPFGSRILKTDSYKREYADVRYGNLKGRVPAENILDKDDFMLFKGIFSSTDALEAIPSIKNRRALLKYYKDNDMVSVLTDREKRDIYNNAPPPQWQLIVRHGLEQPGEVFFKRIFVEDGKYADMVVLLTDIDSDKRKAVVFHTSKDGKTRAVCAKDVSAEGGIADVTLDKYYHVGEGFHLRVKFSGDDIVSIAYGSSIKD